MQFSTLLNRQATAFITTYKETFLKTIRVTLLLTTCCFLVGALIGVFADPDTTKSLKPISVLSYFISRFSYDGTYRFVDTVKIIFLFVVSSFSLKTIRREGGNMMKLTDVVYLLLMLIVGILLDCAFFRLESQADNIISNRHLFTWLRNVIFQFRIYVPMILFSLTIQICLSKTDFNFKEVLFLFIALWFFNELAYEITLLVRSCVFELLLAPFDSKTDRYWYESVLGIGLITSFFLGYSCAMTTPFTLRQDDNNES